MYKNNIHMYGISAKQKDKRDLRAKRTLIE